MGTQTVETNALRGALVAAAALVLAAPTPAASVRTLADAGAAAQVADPLVALLALLAWLCATYLLVVAALMLGSRLPGLAGTALGTLARVSAPAALRRSLGLALGVTLAVGTLAGPVSADSGLQVQVRVQASSLPAPVVAPAPTSTPSLDHPVAAPTPSLDHPVASPTPSLDHPLTAGAGPAPELDWPTEARPAAAVAPSAAADAVPVVVQPGDTLWDLAEQQLERSGAEATDAQVAQAWPSWWQANREAVGDDPDLLRPGTPLVPPTATPPTDA